jgi:hypothetical protein
MSSNKDVKTWQNVYRGRKYNKMDLEIYVDRHILRLNKKRLRRNGAKKAVFDQLEEVIALKSITDWGKDFNMLRALCAADSNSLTLW